ncbi:MAG: T9SS type A sorting domain-containing protein [Flavobacteriales bacterium]|nr:T9SS type A sorting domain-containing protein [Flavobacteriales bacterium]
MQIYHQAPASIEENRANLFNIFPNPVSNGALKIELNETSPATVNTVNVAGQAVHTYTIENQYNSVDVSNLAPGMYLVHLTQNG